MPLHRPAPLTGLDQAAMAFLAPAQADDEIGRLGPYRILKVLGKGGMGMVFKADDPALDRTVALKIMLPEVASRGEAKERFLREAKAAAKIEHEHIIPIFQVGEDRGIPYIAMSFLKGMSLDDWLKQKRPLAIPQILRIGRETAKGLAAAHERGLIHRDIKPANLWLDSSSKGKVKILDFGLARPETEDTGLTQSGQIVGTPAYMSPEQAAGEKLDGRSDLFSLGVVLYRLIAGQLPFRGPNMMAILTALATQDHEPVATQNPETPPALASLIDRLLAKDPSKRPASAREVVDAIAAIERERILKKLGAETTAAATQAPVERQTPRTVTSTLASQAFAFEDSADSHITDEDFAAASLASPKKALARWPMVAGGGVTLGIVALILVVILNRRPPAPSPVEAKPSPPDVPPMAAVRAPAVALAPFDRTAARDLQAAWAKYLGKPVEVSNSLKMKLVLIPPGEFRMGKKSGHTSDPEHLVRITHPYYLGAYEVTHKQFVDLMPDVKFVKPPEPDMPGGGVSWDHAAAFCERLSKQPSERAAGRRYRLPTEAEWEHACRAGTQTRFSFGDLESSADGNFLIAKGAKASEFTKGGQYPANAWGLFDMHGNLREWCSDWHDAEYPKSSPTNDPAGPKTGTSRVYRGGGRSDPAISAGRRLAEKPDVRYSDIGFRVLCEVDLRPPTNYVNSLGMEFALIPKGKSWLGGGKAETDIPRDFYLGVTEVTQEEWERVMGTNPSHCTRDGPMKDSVKDIADADLKHLPVDNVSWVDCQAFVAKLNEIANVPGWTYRLPTEAEWEYAARGGPMADPSERLLNYGFELQYPTTTAVRDMVNFNSKGPVKVGSYPPNALGLYDMNGNVWEWCETGTRDQKAVRGGCWSLNWGQIFTGRRGVPPADHNSSFGLRVARVPTNR